MQPNIRTGPALIVMAIISFVIYLILIITGY